ncbi:WcaI family glycosyltransferase [Aquimarina gracilis]|uniref:WcaI family glycosyltransferase n=1 Tax=Aquimarina gracilis TaxID=874422 RepID=A0ABU6A0Q1_9FLAO|nr:WcaI family glycosyltransferase [Aquimarina gracilis]MEB3347740.1 WcaI family glycosyltransferase [Aquimarina gracilis]
MTSKKITLIGVNFYPEDTAIGLYSTDMARYFVEKGHTVNVVTGFPYYPQWRIKDSYKKKSSFYQEEVDGIRIYRYKQYVPKKPNFIKRIFHLIDFTIGSWFNLFKIKETDIVISIVPFTSTILLGWILKKRRKANLWVHVQDFEFDAALQSGVTKSSKGIKTLIFKILFGIEKWLFSKADIASTISNTMLKKLDRKAKAESFFLPNWIDANKINPESAQKHAYLNSNKFKILYSGNIGDKQNWEFFLEFIKELDTERTEIIVVGDGAKKEWLLDKIKEYNFVKYFSPVPFEELSDLLCSADLHILFQKEDVIDTVMPSKLLGMMASATPSLVTGNIQSEVKKVLDESRGGYYLSEANVNQVMNVVNNLVDDKTVSQEMGLKAREYIVNRFSKNKILETLNNKLEEV